MSRSQKNTSNVTQKDGAQNVAGDVTRMGSDDHTMMGDSMKPMMPMKHR